MPHLDTRLRDAIGVGVASSSPLSGGCVADVRRVELEDGRTVVVKQGDASAKLDVEGFMLNYLRERSTLPVPEVLYDAPELLVMTFLPSAGSGGRDDGAQRHAGELIGALHVTTSDNGKYGLERDTLIGSLDQPNPWTESWVDFFRDARLLDMSRRACAAGQLPKDIMQRIESFARRMPDFVDEPPAPALIHGDIWSGNVLADANCIAGFVDPAIYYADPEMELAFITLFGTFGRAFFEAYQERRPIRDGFFGGRCDVYNLFPLLVHVHLFGGSYVNQVAATLARLGF